MTWQPEDDEVLQLRQYVEFATGVARAVEGRRSFRDTDRRDIERELQDEGWPPRPEFDLLTAPEQQKQSRVNGVLRVAELGVALVTELFTANGDVGSAKSPESKDPENEVDDFPVLWGGRESIARSVPWELDQSRRPRSMGRDTVFTDFAVTDRRLHVLGYLPKTPAEAEPLWSLPLPDVTDARITTYPSQVRITFKDQSWIRVTVRHDRAKRLINALMRRSQVVTESELTAGQRDRVAGAADPRATKEWRRTFTRLPGGAVLAEIEDVAAKRTIVLVMGPDGSHVPPQPDEM